MGKKASLKTAPSQLLPSWVTVWFYVTAIICFWDASYIVFRPHSAPGGTMAIYWYLYKFYVALDRRYGDLSDAFVFAQSLLNYAEVLLNIVTLIMHYKTSRHTRLLAFTVSVMTFWKTVLYFLMFSEFCGDGKYREGNSAFDEFFLVVIPNGVWIVMPFLAMISLGKGLLPIEPVQATDNGYLANGHCLKQSSLANGHDEAIHLNGNMKPINGHVQRRKKF